MKRFAFVTNEGTATPETTLCKTHVNVHTHRMYVKNVICPDDVDTFVFVDVSENSACKCIICGK